MILERTYDRKFITKCVTDDHVWRASCDDTPIDKDFFFPPINDTVIWLRAGDYGVFMGQKMNHVTFECHTCLLPKARGKAVDIARCSIQWIFENTNCLRLITQVPSYNKLAERLSVKSGMTKYGTNPGSFKKDDVLYDVNLYGISKHEVIK